MNVSKILPLVLILFFNVAYKHYSYSQDYSHANSKVLVLTKNRSGKTKIIKEEKRIKIWLTSEKKPIKGNLKINDDQTISIDDRTLNISDIAQIRAKTIGTKVFGGILTATGAGLSTYGVGIVSSRTNHLDVDPTATDVAGSLLFVIGLIPTISGIALLTNGRKYKLYSKWSLSIQAY